MVGKNKYQFLVRPQFLRMFNRIEEHIFGHGRRESFRYPIERTGIVATDVSFGVAPTYLDNRHDLNAIACQGSANMGVKGTIFA